MSEPDRRSALAEDLARMQVDLALRGLLKNHLPPSQWEALRQKLQRIYRDATGEPHATLIVQEPRP